jgi:MFS family permease
MASGDRGSDPLAALDGAGISRHQIKIMFVSGMGFLADAYDLFVIGIVVSLLKTEWALSTSQVSWLNSATLAASAVGALVFGRIADIFGRRRVYGFEVLILAAGALASAFAPNFTCLLISRIVLGIGVGGDYPVSATIMSEYAGKRSRGRLVGLVFAMQGAGLVVGPLAAAVLLGSGISHGAAWRILLALGAVPALSVFYLRRRISETPQVRSGGRRGRRRRRGHRGRDHRARNKAGAAAAVPEPAPAEHHRRVLRAGHEPGAAALAGRHGRRVVPARLRLLRQHDLLAADPQAAQPARHLAA